MDPNLLDEFLQEKQKGRRRKLIPTWIKIFIWIFMVMGALSIPVFIVGLLRGNFQISLYGYETNRADSIVGISLTAVFFLKGFVSYSLWLEKDWAITLAIFDAVMGIIICIFSMFGVSFTSDHLLPFSFRLEIILLIPYLIKLGKIRAPWRAVLHEGLALDSQ